jgi:hypothetical protein
MKKTHLIAALLVLAAHAAWAGELTAISSKFVHGAAHGDLREIASTLWEGGPAKEGVLADFKTAAPEIAKGKVKLTPVDRELVIGELGVTLMRFEVADGKFDFKPIVCLKTKDGWRVFPWSSEADLKVLFDQRTKEEQIHLRLFNEWAHLMGKLLAEEAGSSLEKK